MHGKIVVRLVVLLLLLVQISFPHNLAKPSVLCRNSNSHRPCNAIPTWDRGKSIPKELA